QDRDAKGRPIFEDHLAYPTSPGQFRLFKKVEDYISNIYYDTTIVPMGGEIKWQKNKWVFQNKNGQWRTLPQTLASDLSLPEAQRKYTFYDAVANPSGEVESVKWGNHPFGKYAMQTTVDGKNAFPELIHSSGDLMMEERQLVNDLIKLLSAPYDNFDECVKNNSNFDLYKACYDFVANPTRQGLLQMKEAANYRLYYGLPLSSAEVKAVPADAIIADKILRNKTNLTPDEIKIAVEEDIAYWRGGKLKVNMEKVLGISFDTYQYVVTIQKFAHHYEVLKNNWNNLNNLRWALLKDFNNFVIKDEALFSSVLRELMLRRIRLERLTQQTGIEVLTLEIRAR
ncbi:MAG: hypothetical protein QME05_06095, partial [Candidatus Margulisbacteria bacterium]|nr:hypothetical protein [Candidatus Margulisiibacteriota bacterium]